MHIPQSLRLQLGATALLFALQAQAEQPTVPALLLPDTEPIDTFYQVTPAELGVGEHGHLIRQKDIVPPAGLENSSRNILIIYKSNQNDQADTPRAVSAIVAIPKGQRPADGWPVVSWAHGTLGSADKCAPSMDNQLVADTPALVLHKKINYAPHEMLNAFLSAGWAVVMTDYEGTGTVGPHPYLNGQSEARGILDAVRAAHQLPSDAQGSPQFSNSFAIVGHSQGGQAALFAAHYKPSWTNELDLVGVAAVAPASKLSDLQFLPGLSLVNPEAREGLPFLILSILGAQRGDPSIDLNRIFTSAGLALFNETADSMCRTELSDSRWTQPSQGLFNSLTASVLNEQLVAMHPNLAISVPIRISQATNDLRVTAEKTRALAKELNVTNAQNGSAPAVCYKEYATVAPADPVSLGDHFGTLKSDIGNMLTWLSIRFSHQTLPLCDAIPESGELLSDSTVLH
ncbi:alpha/beta fold hydrolase [Collimonas sp. NPDC087041]|uniref:alpha/beta fold hydrolase n=1 Tax=Collimonas sp. NPDC087041 TaxID=3363960 RepID=UPI003813DD24